MTQALSKTITFEEFVQCEPESSRYELHEGVVVEMQPTGDHEEIKGFLNRKLNVESDRLSLPCLIPSQAARPLLRLVKTPDKLHEVVAMA